jgi:hypothetical protein
MPVQRTQNHARPASGLQTDAPRVPISLRHPSAALTPVEALDTPAGFRSHLTPADFGPTTHVTTAPTAHLDRLNAAGYCRVCLHPACTDQQCVTHWAKFTFAPCDTCHGTGYTDNSRCDCADGVRAYLTVAISADPRTGALLTGPTPHPAPATPGSGVLLKTLLCQRHWQTYRTFCREYDKAAATIDKTLIGSWPSRAQLHRWLTGTMKGLPYPDSCRVLEAMFPGYTANQLMAVI